MSCRNPLLSLLAAVWLLANSVHSEPRIVSIQGEVSVFAGGTALLQCRVQDLGGRSVTWTSVTHDFVISKDRQIITHDLTQFSIIRALDGAVYDLQILSAQKKDHGYYKCAIEGTEEAIYTSLKVSDAPDFPIGDSPSLNKTDCCVAKGISSTCQPACVPDLIDLEQFDALNSCGTVDDLVVLSQCFSDGSNHDTCCLNFEVNELCLPFCHDGVQEIELSVDHLTTCFTEETINKIFECFEYGSIYLPSAPLGVSALPLHSKEASILVKWEAPLKNPSQVTGYKIMYKPSNKNNYFSYIVTDPSQHEHRLTTNLIPNMHYKIHVSALAQHGTSFSSAELDVFIPDTSLEDEQNVDIDACCVEHKVDEDCRNSLCRSKTWSSFNTDAMLSCLGDIDSVFHCLAGGQNHTGCCAAYGVTSFCQPLCSGHPPAFDDSLIVCISQLNIIEGCIQQGYETLAKPPSLLSLIEVSSKLAVLSFEPSESPDVLNYVVELRDVDRQEHYNETQTLNSNEHVIRLEMLEPNTNYDVRVVTVAKDSGSLPSVTVSFRTYSANYGKPTPPPLINQEFDFQECCKDKGMIEDCWQGCVFAPNITAYYATRVAQCYNDIGSVLTCASDGRDHRPCCEREEVQTLCLDLCNGIGDGALEQEYIACIADTSKAIKCFQEGLVDLPRHPDVVVSTVTTAIIAISWVQPPTSGKIDEYKVVYGLQGTSEQDKNVSIITETHFILQNLKAGKAYEIQVFSINENGTSAPSPMITQFTNTVNVTVPDSDEITDQGRALWKNVEECCAGSSISSQCLDSCLNKQTSQTDECLVDSAKILACFADGQDHSVCCVEKNLQASCLPLCRGHSGNITLSTASCMSYGNRDIILSCFLNNRGLVPSAPSNFLAKPDGVDSADLSWAKSSFCELDCTYTVHYWKDGDKEHIMTKNAVTSPVKVSNLEVGFKYSFTVTARNTYGGGPPSSQVTVLLTEYNRIVKIYMKNTQVVVDEGLQATLQCVTSEFDPNDLPTLQWLFNGRPLAGQTQELLTISEVNHARDEGTYTCKATDQKVSLTESIFLPIKYSPVISEIRDESAAPGGNAKVACWFNGFPDTTGVQWMKDGQPIANDRDKYKASVDPRYHTGITSYKINIYNIEENDYGDYSIAVKNKFGQTSCHVKLLNPDTVVPVAPAKKEDDPLLCCQRKGLSDVCQEICSFDIDIVEILADSKYISCLAYFDDLVSCSADGQDHSKCCKEAGVAFFCIPYCNGVSPGSALDDQEELLQCVAETETIFGCAQRGRDLLPYAPRDVTLSAGPEDNSMIVRWSPPEFNHHLVEHYKIFCEDLDSKTAKPTITVNEKITEKVILDLEINGNYSVWVTAGNKKGESQISNKATFSLLNYLPSSPSNVKVTSASDSNLVLVTWELVPKSNVDVQSYTIYYWKLNQARPKTIVGVKDKSYEFKDLEAVTDYKAYVTAVATNGDESPPSETISFKTGQYDGSQSANQDGDDNVAVGVGVTVGLILLAAIIVIIVFFIFRRKLFPPKTNDTVAFENPGFGDQGVVKIESSSEDHFSYGRLQEDERHAGNNPSSGNNVYDNNPPAVHNVYDNNGVSTDQITVEQPQQDFNNSFATLDVKTEI